jgi:hypothetical protein
MIQANGTIILNDGIISVVNPLINVFTTSADKFSPTYGVAQYGRISEKSDGVKRFDTYGSLGGENAEWNTGEIIDPSFTDVQLAVLNGLEERYPEVTFSIIP